MRTLGSLLRRNAHFYGNDEALVFEGGRTTYARLAERGGRLAAALYRLGMRRQDRLSILAMNCPQYLEVYAAAHLAGYLAGTVNYRLTAPEIHFVVTDSAPSVLIFEAQYADAVASLRESAPSIRHFVCIGNGPEWALSYEALVDAETEANAPIEAEPDDYAHLMYSSGTTGRPKGVIKSHRAELARGEIFAAQLRMLQNQRSLVIMPLFHTGATSIVLASQWAGASVVLHRKFDASAVLGDIERERIAMTHMAPTIIRALLDHPELERHDLSSLTTLFYASAPMPVALLQRAIARFGPILCNGYGMTEGGGTFLQKHHHRPDGSERDRRRLYSVGQAVARAEIRIVDDSGAELQTGEAGEISIRSAFAMSCYWNNSVATHETLKDGWLRTGDVGTMDEDGFVYLVDRKKDMIISGGENIYCQEVEQVLMNCEGVSEAAVLGVPDDYWGESVAAAIVREPGSTVDAETLTAFSNAHLARYKVPRIIEFRDALPRVASGKVDKRALRASLVAGSAPHNGMN